MSKRNFHAGKKEWQYRERSQKYWNIEYSKQANERRITRKIKKESKYDSVSELLSKEIAKRPNIDISYRSLLPVVRELIASSKYLSARFSENDIESITIIVVRKCHSLSKDKINNDLAKEE